MTIDEVISVITDRGSPMTLGAVATVMGLHGKSSRGELAAVLAYAHKHGMLMRERVEIEGELRWQYSLPERDGKPVPARNPTSATPRPAKTPTHAPLRKAATKDAAIPLPWNPAQFTASENGAGVLRAMLTMHGTLLIALPWMTAMHELTVEETRAVAALCKGVSS